MGRDRQGLQPNPWLQAESTVNLDEVVASSQILNMSMDGDRPPRKALILLTVSPYAWEACPCLCFVHNLTVERRQDGLLTHLPVFLNVWMHLFLALGDGP